MAKRLDALVEAFPHLGATPEPVHVSADDWSSARLRFADEPYSPEQPLVRVALLDGGTDTAERVLIAAHHGAADGIGLLALLGAVLDEPVASSARGVTGRAVSGPFLRSAAQRLNEAAFRPPTRVAADGVSTADVLRAGDVDAERLDTATLIAAGAAAVRGYNATRGKDARRVVAAVGASKSGGGRPSPRHDSTFLRLPVPVGASADDVRELLRAQPPEPDFPTAASRVASTAARALAARLGSTFLASNLGLITADSLAAVRFHPAASGPNGLSFGLASTPSTSTVTVRARGAYFSADAAEQLLQLVVRELGGRGG